VCVDVTHSLPGVFVCVNLAPKAKDVKDDGDHRAKFKAMNALGRCYFKASMHDAADSKVDPDYTKAYYWCVLEFLCFERIVILWLCGVRTCVVCVCVCVCVYVIMYVIVRMCVCV